MLKLIKGENFSLLPEKMGKKIAAPFSGCIFWGGDFDH
jgi:hypothetical protein